MLAIVLGRGTKAVAVALAAAVAAVVLFPGLMQAPGGTGVADAVLTANKAGSQNGAFEIRGNVAGLYPGVRRNLRLKIENPHAFALSVTELYVTVGGITGCPGRSLQVNDTPPPSSGANKVRVRVTAPVPARGEIFVDVPVVLLNSAGDGCQNASLPLTYSGKAVKA